MSLPALFHVLSPRQLVPGRRQRLVETLLVRDEVELIELNLRAHAALGVEGFVVMDNGSTDGTREVLEELRGELELIVIDRPEDDYRQSEWKTELAFTARDRLGADWSFNADADEFWLPTDGDDLRAGLSPWGTVLLCPRSNLVHDRRLFEPGYHVLDADLRVKCPIDTRGHDVVGDPTATIFLGPIKGKVLVNAHGLLRVKGGNHRAWHARAWRGPRAHPSVHIAHYPMRSWEHFLRHVERRVALLRRGVTRMGLHYKRWARQYEEGELEREFERLVLAPEEVRVLERFGVLERDPCTGPRIRGLAAGRPAAGVQSPAGAPSPASSRPAASSSTSSSSRGE